MVRTLLQDPESCTPVASDNKICTYPYKLKFLLDYQIHDFKLINNEILVKSGKLSKIRCIKLTQY